MEQSFVAAQNNDSPKFRRLLICEGPEDRLFFHQLIQVRSLPGFHIWDTGARTGRGGNSKFDQAIRAFRASRPKTYGSLRDIIIVADNDETPDANFENVCRQIEGIFGAGTAPTAPQRRTLKIKPAITILMMPWTGRNGHLERLCINSAHDADKKVGVHVNNFMAVLAADKWNNESRVGKAWLRTNLAARCVVDPFVALGHVFEEPKYQTLIPLDHASFKPVADFLASF